MRREDYWNLFWLSGMPEAWMMTRPKEDNPLFARPGINDLTDLNGRVFEDQKQPEQTDHIG